MINTKSYKKESHLSKTVVFLFKLEDVLDFLLLVLVAEQLGIVLGHFADLLLSIGLATSKCLPLRIESFELLLEGPDKLLQGIVLLLKPAERRMGVMKGCK